MTDEAQKRTRASGDVLDYLINEFEQNPNPGPDQRKEFSEKTGMPEKAVRIWFQNRRAKFRKLERQGKPVKPTNSYIGPKGQPSHAYSSSNNNSVHSSRSNLLTNVTKVSSNSPSVPTDINEKYCFVDCTSLSVGTWQRVKTGAHDNLALLKSLFNLSPFTLDKFMHHVDLMVIFSKKNSEINYFFLAVANNSKVLFRIFYPLASVATCSLLHSSIDEDSIELRLNLTSKPKFSVYFFNGVNGNLNQWSICDDFSENQQVSSAYYAPGGTSTPHVLVGNSESLHHLHKYVQLSKDYPFNAPIIGGTVDTRDPLLHEPHNVGTRDSIDEREFLHLVENDRALMNSALHFSLDNNNEAWNDAHHDQEMGVNGISQGDDVSPNSPTPHLTEHSAHFDEHKGNRFEGHVFESSTDFFDSVELSGPNLQLSRLQDVKEVPDLKSKQIDSGLEGDQGELHDLHHIPGSNQFGYEVEVDPSEFEATNLIIESPTLATHSPIPDELMSSQADNFIDYNAHA